MQIVAGRFRHRKLLTTPGQTTRPILTRVKVSLFDRLQPELQGARIADIFAGTGTLGLEALSRGAASVVFIENDVKAVALLRQNVRALRVESETVCWMTDVDRCSFRPKRADGLLPYDVVFFDPPYPVTRHLHKGHMLHRAITRLARDGITSSQALLVLRCEKDTQFDMPEVWQLERFLDYSSMEVHLFRRAAAVAESSTEELIEQPILDETAVELETGSG
ncbi:MAG: 16S rRNA (guanine(966)-N(2))-methyltransferase RsmD [Planctomycetales bacterium]|nr:16S rRNA (guanine(966)-N(2))-methyltransferase RsmD [Planctomycetales bacterium]